MKPAARPPAAIPDIWTHRGGASAQLHFLVNRSGNADAARAMDRVLDLVLDRLSLEPWVVVLVRDEFKIRIDTECRAQAELAYKVLIKAAKEAGVEAA